MPTWTTPATKKWLETRKHAFQEAQDANKLEEFWVRELANFYEEFPTPDAETEGGPQGSGVESSEARGTRENQGEQTTNESDRRKGRTKQIKDWFYNSTRKSRKTVNLLVVVRGKEEHVPSVKQMWSKRFYNGSKAQKQVEKEMQTKGVPDKQQLSVYHKHLNAEFAQVSQKVWDELEKEREELVTKKREEEEMVAKLLSGAIDANLSPEEIAKVQDSVVTVLKNFLTLVQGKTGDWTFCLLAGGPLSSHHNAPIQVEAFDVGGLPDGTTFSEWYPSFSNLIEKPFTQFCHVMYRECSYVTSK